LTVYLCTLAYSYEQLPAGASESERVEFVMADLKAGLEGMARALFGDVEMRWVDAYFPFTDPSAELEIFFGVNMSLTLYYILYSDCYYW
jgi:phenylalanyl-tRNA synthetase alpha subunit